MSGPRCVVCGGRLGFSSAIDHLGDVLCPGCTDLPSCLACDAGTGGDGVRARTVLPDGRVRCRRCSAGAVDSRADIAPVVALVRPLLQSYGVRLPNRVRVELASIAEIEDRVGRGPMAYTLTEGTGIGLPTVVELRIVSGLPATMFGRALAHEMGHGWLAGCPDIGRSSREDEGLCELLASWWLRHRGGRLADHLLEVMRRNPDPVYGDGYRLAAHAAEGMSPEEVVARVTRSGCIRR